jgi:hypothetical protein
MNNEYYEVLSYRKNGRGGFLTVSERTFTALGFRSLSLDVTEIERIVP